MWGGLQKPSLIVIVSRGWRYQCARRVRKPPVVGPTRTRLAGLLLAGSSSRLCPPFTSRPVLRPNAIVRRCLLQGWERWSEFLNCSRWRGNEFCCCRSVVLFQECREYYRSSWPPILLALAIWLSKSNFELPENAEVLSLRRTNGSVLSLEYDRSEAQVFNV